MFMQSPGRFLLLLKKPLYFTVRYLHFPCR